MVAMVKLGEVCDTGIQNLAARNLPDEFSYIDISSIDNQSKRIVTPAQVRRENASPRARQLIRSGDVLVSSVRPNLNAVAMVPAELDGQIGSTGFCLLRAGKNLDRDYLFLWVCSNTFITALTDLTKGALYPAVTDKQVLAQTLPLPPLPEQQRIAARLKAQLAEVEAARSAANAARKAADQLSKAVLREAFVGITGGNRLGDVLLDIQAGKSLQTLERKADAEEPGILKVSAVSWGKFDPDEAKATEAQQCDPAWSVRADDFIISRANTLELVGAVVIAQDDYPLRFLSDKLLRLVLNRNLVDPVFMLFQLRGEMARTFIESNATGTSQSMRNIGQGVIRDIPVWLPPLLEQQCIAARLKVQLVEVETARGAVQTRLEAIDNLPQRLLAEAFERV